jgi:hypothetical protein
MERACFSDCSCVQIFVRVRPFNHNEVLQGMNSCVQIRSDCQISLMPHTDAGQFRVDKVFGGHSTQEDVFGGAVRCSSSCLMHAHRVSKEPE